MMEPWTERLLDEYDDLTRKLDKLNHFLIASRPGEGVSESDYKLMLDQRIAMISYRNALTNRIRAMLSK